MPGMILCGLKHEKQPADKNLHHFTGDILQRPPVARYTLSKKRQEHIPSRSVPAPVGQIHFHKAQHPIRLP
jgi:hypothetical protein